MEKMKKRFFNVTIGGYYVVSIILGIAMALTVSLAACDLWFHAYESHKMAGELLTIQDDLEVSKMYVPMYSIVRELYSMPGTAFDWEYLENYIPIFLMVSAVAVVFLSVMIMEGKSANKAWRQKMLQAGAITMLIILFVVAGQCVEKRMFGKWSYMYSMRVYNNITTWHILAPIVLLIIPLFILKKTRIREGKPATKLEPEEMPMPRPGDREPIKG